MPNVPHTAHMVASGLINNVQSWSTGLWFTYEEGLGMIPSSRTVVNAFAGSEDLAGYWTTWWNAIANIQSTIVSFKKVTYYAYGEDPTTPAMNEWALPGAATGTASTSVPPEVAVVASLRTASAGASYRGRSYFPLLGTVPTALGQLGGAAAGQLSSAYGALLSSINGHDFDAGPETHFGVTAAVVSKTKTIATPITYIDVDTRFDAQRRRQDKLPGTSHITTL